MAWVILSRIILFRRDNTIMSCSHVMSNLHFATRSQMKLSQLGKPAMSSSGDKILFQKNIMLMENSYNLIVHSCRGIVFHQYRTIQYTVY